MKGSGDFSIGSAVWPGISKLTEECGEVMQVCGKLVGSHGEVIHFDGSDLRKRMQEELADLLAAIEFVVAVNPLDYDAIAARRDEKLKLFHAWHDADIAKEEQKP
ncbi:MazG nucleotide pyrophosphohydrolase domain-containing protein [Kaistia soli DSM 19436]|uniref:MazG nucleotide pyrophosphohydrolase domain-containing protein n=1 Tax=Kaistia soli DSM 19436 TaxID=1122133 RepID=A0A1M4Y6I4_9HYPH|nr:MazG nucleotide pyrophosphohydrolase domain-containing protein [Kaistia soli]SHF01183.1 MazG nucleotide pyrophosphohydrolase domain-containing protein [Kaistia soli DSM 19436]